MRNTEADRLHAQRGTAFCVWSALAEMLSPPNDGFVLGLNKLPACC